MFTDDSLQPGQLLRGRRQAEQRDAMSRGGRAAFDGLDRLLGQAQQPHTLRDRHPVLADPLAECLLGQAEVAQ